MKAELTNRNFIIRIVVFALAYAVVDSVYRSAGRGPVSVTFIISSFIAGVLSAVVLGYAFSRVRFRLRVRIAVAWLVLFVIGVFSNIVEGYFFTTQISTVPLFMAATMMGLVITLVQAVLVGVLFSPKGPFSPLTTEMKSFFAQRPWHSWFWRIALCSLVYFPIYFTFGAIISPVVLPYYASLSYGLRIPSFEVMVPLEFLRGFLYVITLLPLLAVIRLARGRLYAVVVSILYVIGAVAPFLTDETLPVLLRTVHGLEILGDCLVFGAAIVHLLGRRL
jgi:hypothetical protein